MMAETTPRRRGCRFAVLGVAVIHLGSFAFAFAAGALLGTGRPTFSAQGGSTTAVRGLEGAWNAVGNLLILHILTAGLLFLSLSIAGAIAGFFLSAIISRIKRRRTTTPTG